MDMRVIGHDPYAKDVPTWIETVGLARLWAESDAISLHCPLTDNNRDLINAATLAQCRDGVLLVNTARGGLVNGIACPLGAHYLPVPGDDAREVQDLLDQVFTGSVSYTHLTLPTKRIV